VLDLALDSERVGALLSYRHEVEPRH